MKKYYCIRINANEELAEKVLPVLFSKGYVFGPATRHKTWEQVKGEYWGHSCNWVLINFDSECSRALMWGYGRWNESNGFTEVTIEQFVELIDKGIV